MIKYLFPEINCARQQSLNELLLSICKKHGVTVDQLKSTSRDQKLVYVRYEFTKKADSMCTHKKDITDILNRGRTMYNHYMNEYVPINQKEE